MKPRPYSQDFQGYNFGWDSASISSPQRVLSTAGAILRHQSLGERLITHTRQLRGPCRITKRPTMSQRNFCPFDLQTVCSKSSLLLRGPISESSAETVLIRTSTSTRYFTSFRLVMCSLPYPLLVEHRVCPVRMMQIS